MILIGFKLFKWSTNLLNIYDQSISRHSSSISSSLPILEGNSFILSWYMQGQTQDFKLGGAKINGKKNFGRLVRTFFNVSSSNFITLINMIFSYLFACSKVIIQIIKINSLKLCEFEHWHFLELGNAYFLELEHPHL